MIDPAPVRFYANATPDELVFDGTEYPVVMSVHTDGSTSGDIVEETEEYLLTLEEFDTLIENAIAMRNRLLTSKGK